MINQELTNFRKLKIYLIIPPGSYKTDMTLIIIKLMI